MSVQEIPSVAQLEAARAVRWHQAVETVEEPAADAASGEAALAAAATEHGRDRGVTLPDDAGGEGGGELSGESDAPEEMASGEDVGEAEDEAAAEAWDDAASAEEDAEVDPALDDGEDDDDAEGVEGDFEGEDTLAVDDVDEEDETPVRVAAVQTLEAAREMVEQAGLLLFAPQAAMSTAPAPTLVEATLGRAAKTATLAETQVARSLLARLVAEGSAVPLNLLGAGGTTGEAPDFVASAATFSYVFTLRGDKSWKVMPSTTGSNKVSPLAVNAYGLLVENGPQTATALVDALGKGLTEAAVLRALGELWQQLRVIPVSQLNGKATVWEPVGARLLKQVRSGSNAGVPTALSALISLYLGQALLATEEQIETFLSPLSPRSRVRDVVHALLAAQQLETMTIAGKHHLHVAGELPAFGVEGAVSEGAEERRGPRFAGDGSRIRRMERDGAAAGVGRAKPFRKPGFARRGEGERGGGSPRGGFGGGERRTGWAAKRPGGFGGGFGGGRRREGGENEAGGRPARFDRPWEERPARARREEREGGTGEELAASGEERRPARGGFSGGRTGLRQGGFGAGGARGPKPFGGGRPGGSGRFGGGGRSGGERAGGDADRPRSFRPREEGGSGPAGRRAGGEFRPRPERGEGGFAPRRDRPGGGFAPRREGGFAPPRRDRGAGFGDRGGFAEPREGRGEFRPRPDRGEGFGGRPDRGTRGQEGGFAGGEERPKFRRFDAPRPGGKRPFGGERGEGGAKRSFGEGGRPGGSGRFAAGEGRPARGGFGSGFGGRREGEGGGERRPFAGGAPRAKREFRGDGAGFQKEFRGGGKGRPEGGRSFGGPRPGSGTRPGAGEGGRPGGPFDKFKGGNKPWGKRPPARKVKREGDEG